MLMRLLCGVAAGVATVAIIRHRFQKLQNQNIIIKDVVNGKRKAVCVFLGSREGIKPGYVQAAVKLGQTMAEKGIVLVYGGGNVGLMGALATAQIEAGGHVIGVIPRALAPREISGVQKSGIETIYTDTMHERKQIMASLVVGFICLPGGFGTMEEACESITWTQLGIQEKPVAFLNIHGFWNHILAMFQHAVDEGFISGHCMDIVVQDENPVKLLDKLLNSKPPKGLCKSWPSSMPVTKYI